MFVSAALHRAVIDVNEEGTEAAGASAAAISLRMMEMNPELRCDHPFLFLIRSRIDAANNGDSVGVVYFMGRFVTPPQGKCSIAIL